MIRRLACIAALVALAVPSIAPVRAAEKGRSHNVVLFVPDGLRATIVDKDTAPTMAAIRDGGVDFSNSHSLFPTFTTPNASAMATGHYLGDTGDFSNTENVGFQVPGAGLSLTPFLESDPVLGDVDEHFAGDYIDEETVLAAARAKGYSTASIGKLGPALIFDHTERTGAKTIEIDDSTGSPAGIPLAPEISAALKAAGLPVVAPSRGDNGRAGTSDVPGTLSPNLAQQQFFVDAATKVVLPLFKARDTPFVLVYWSRDPDGTQHNQGDSLNALTPGIDGPTSLAAIKNADRNLAQLRAALDSLGLSATTDIVIAADHGFSTISKQSKTSQSTHDTYPGVPKGFLPPGFLAIDIASALGLPLSDPDKEYAIVHPELGKFPSRANGLIGMDTTHPDVVVAANGGSDLVYLPQANARELAPRVIATLLAQDYVSGLFVDDALGTFPGTLTTASINLKGSAITPFPAIVVNFTSQTTGCAKHLLCTTEVADTVLQQGQGMHGSFSRADTNNFMAAIGPDFKQRFVDRAPASNADVGKTLAEILQLTIPAKGKLVGRVLSEAFVDGVQPPAAVRHVERSTPAPDGTSTILLYQQVGTTKYFDAAGFKARTVGL